VPQQRILAGERLGFERAAVVRLDRDRRGDLANHSPGGVEQTPLSAQIVQAEKALSFGARGVQTRHGIDSAAGRAQPGRQTSGMCSAPLRQIRSCTVAGATPCRRAAADNDNSPTNTASTTCTFCSPDNSGDALRLTLAILRRTNHPRKFEPLDGRILERMFE